MSRAFRGLLIACAVTPVLAGCDAETGNLIDAVLTGESPSGWQISDTSDPMSDSRLQVATAQIKSGRYTMETEITCRDGEKLQYSVSTFEGEKGASIRKAANPAFSLFGKADLYHSVVEMRLDSGPSKEVAPYDGDYSNNLVFRSDDDVSDMRKAELITLRVPLQNGVAVFRIDQSERKVRKLLDACQTDRPDAAPGESDATASEETETGEASTAAETAGTEGADADDGSNPADLSTIMFVNDRGENLPGVKVISTESWGTLTGVLKLDLLGKILPSTGSQNLRIAVSFEAPQGGDFLTLISHGCRNSDDFIVEAYQSSRVDKVTGAEAKKLLDSSLDAPLNGKIFAAFCPD